MIMWSSHIVGCLLCVALIVAGSAINFWLANRYNLTIGLIDTNNFFLFQSIISKPWTKFGNIGIGGILACFYYRLLKYREQKTDQDKKANHYVIHTFVKSGALGGAVTGIGGLLVVANLLITWPANCDPAGTSRKENAWYYAISRSSFVLGIAMMIWAIFLGHSPKTRAMMSGSNMRMVSRSIAIGCVLEVVMIELLYCSDSLPQGLYITFPIALILGVGFKFFTPVVSIFIMVGLEFPLTRLLQFFILPHISHDLLLEEHHNNKGIESQFEKANVGIDEKFTPGAPEHDPEQATRDLIAKNPWSYNKEHKEILAARQ